MRKINIFLIAISLIILLTAFLLSAITKIWLITAVIIGFLFGFAMQKGSFCGASIMSSVILYKDYKGVKAFFTTVAFGMIGFAVMSVLGWVTLNPKGLNLLPMALGGFLFGIGTVLGGGCISGSLYKAGEGRFNSMLALLGIGLGTNMIGVGPLSGLAESIKVSTESVKIPNSLYQLAGIDYPIWAAVIFISVIVVLIAFRKRGSGINKEKGNIIDRVLFRKWSIIMSGAVIGVIAWFAYLSSAASGRNYPLGVTGGVGSVAAFLTGAGTNIEWWLFIEVLAIITGSAVAAKLSGDLKFRSADPVTLIIAFGGGIIMGIGAVLANGCFIGNMTSGWALLSIGSLVAGIFTIFGNWITTYFYLQGK